MSELGKELSWDSEISKESEFEILPEGVYDFTISALERGRFAGSDKMCACPSANLTLEVKDPVTGKSGKIFDTLYLNDKAEWRLSQFFTAIGQKKKGEPLRPNWNAVELSKGKLKLSINKYTDKNGNSKENNRVAEYMPPENKWESGKF